jgi:23S rRNA (uracil1939-C5)-methyltransferase
LTRDTLAIEKIIAGGDGLARPAGAPVVFVPRTAPGDVVEVEYVQERKQWRRARPLNVIESGPDRRAAPCPYYDACGGCQLQQLTYGAQLAAKRGIIHDSLRRLGEIEREPPTVVPSPKELGYRNRITLTLRRSAQGVVAGYHHRELPHHIVDVDHCPLAEEPVNAAWSALRRAWGEGAEQLPAGGELRLTLRAAASGEVGLVVEGGEGRGDAEDLLQEVEPLAAIWGLDADGDVTWNVGEAALSDRWGPYRLHVAGAAFLQVNREVAAELEGYLRVACGLVEGRRIIDAYCGFGVRALRLAREGARVVGIDSDPYAVGAARVAAEDSGLPARFVRGEVERVLARELPADLVILNPPRAGVEREATTALERQPPDRIIYVSCDPATLARDLKRMADVFEVVDLRGFDMFPQTAHIETVVSLRRRQGD